jgi:hypothetical protein
VTVVVLRLFHIHFNAVDMGFENVVFGTLTRMQLRCTTPGLSQGAKTVGRVGMQRRMGIQVLLEVMHTRSGMLGVRTRKSKFQELLDQR